MKEQNQSSLSAHVFSQLREDILNGVYPNHQELREQALCEQMGVSRTPVREALRQLSLEGLVDIIPNKGAHVTCITAKDVEDIYEMRSLLEGLCAKMCCQYISSEKMEEMEENIFLAEFHEKKGHVEQLAELDSQFHEIMYESCNSKMLSHTLHDFHEYVKRARKKTLSEQKRRVESNQEHRLIMEAIRAKDAERAEKLANQHVQNAYQNLIRNGLKEVYS